MADRSPRRLCVSHSPSMGPILVRSGLGEGAFQVVWRTDLEVDLKRTQNYCVESLALYLRGMTVSEY